MKRHGTKGKPPAPGSVAAVASLLVSLACSEPYGGGGSDADGVGEDDAGEADGLDGAGGTDGADGTVDPTETDDDGDGWSEANGDCDDTDATISPDGTEVCDDADVDEDCDGVADDADDAVVGQLLWYPDADGDGHAEAAGAVVTACDPPSATGWVNAEGFDCDDADPAVNPAATEVCDNGVDDDCDGLIGGCRLSGALGPSDAAFIAWEPSGSDVSRSQRVGDLDGDGVDDLLLSAHNFDGGQPNAGAAWVVYGPLSGLSVDLSTQPGWAGEAAYGRLGGDIEIVNDQDGDGYAEVLLTQASLSLGTTTIYWQVGPVTASTTATLDGPRVELPDGSNSMPMAAPGDVNGDGIPDVFIAGGRSGVAYLLTSMPTGPVDLADVADQVSDSSGAADALAADVTGDGITDLILFGQGLTDSRVGYGGLAVMEGPISGRMDLDDAVGRRLGDTSGDSAGTTAVVVGDNNGDGLIDLAVGAPSESSWLAHSGAVYLINGPVTGDQRLSSSAAVVQGSAVASTVGYGLCGPGDVDRDGWADLAFNERSSSGHGVWLMYGPVTGTVSLATSARPSDLWLSTSGYAFSIQAADFNSDRTTDLVVGTVADAGPPLHYGAVGWLLSGL